MYEIMTITKADLGEQESKNTSKKISDLIATLGGKVTKDDFWGKRKFAYEIRGSTEGFYDVLTFEIDASKVEKLKTKLNLMTDVLRYLITAKEK
jgi:small subunit ribosomal protein S6